MDISIHAPAQGATPPSGWMIGSTGNFNPRSRTGSDPETFISRHIQANFNPRSRTGSDVLPADDTVSESHFNPRSRTGSDEPPMADGIRTHGFQSTLPHRERLPDGQSSVLKRGIISIHAPAQGATMNSDGTITMLGISIHAPAQGATQIIGGIIQSPDDFNPRSRTGSDSIQKVAAHLHYISIHAPAQGATQIPGTSLIPFGISIHAPAQGATFHTSQGIMEKIYFNPRSRTGSDYPGGGVGIVDVHISIHAPAQGATALSKYRGRTCSFQSTLPHRERHEFIKYNVCYF